MLVASWDGSRTMSPESKCNWLASWGDKKKIWFHCALGVNCPVVFALTVVPNTVLIPSLLSNSTDLILVMVGYFY